MTRPYPPPLLGAPNVEPFDFDASDRCRVADTLGFAELSPDLAGAIAHAVACLKATHNGSCDTTTVTALAALGKLSRPGRSYDAVIERLANDR